MRREVGWVNSLSASPFTRTCTSYGPFFISEREVRGERGEERGGEGRGEREGEKD